MEKIVVRGTSDVANAMTTPVISAAAGMAIDVERNLREQQVGIFFVMPRVVRRVLQSELDIASPWQRPPHRKCCVVTRDRLLWVVARDELGVDGNTKLPEQLILIAQPEEEQLRTMTRQELQRYYWRLMFHARLDFAMLNRTRKYQMPIGELRRLIDRIGQTAFDEIRSVLRAEQMLLRPDDDRCVYAEFVAVYHELIAFAPHLVPIYFPSLVSQTEVLGIIGGDCDAKELLASTRPADLKLEEAVVSDAVTLFQSASQNLASSSRRRSVAKYGRLIRKAGMLSEQGNNVRAALAIQAAVDVAPIEMLEEVREHRSIEIAKLVRRLLGALQLSDDAAEPWLKMCEKLLPGAQRGFWNANARLLYDLQAACIDSERETYKVDLLRWATSLGKSPLKRPLSNQRVVLMSKHLRAASLRVPNIEIDAHGRQELNELLHEAATAAEQILRAKLSPLIETSLTDAGFIPASVVERVSLRKMVQELTDGIVDRGFITLGSLRDAVSRNQLKMTDLTGFEELLQGDPLLRADRMMSASLDGVYPRGPFYLRWLQKISSLAFGISWGRHLSRYVALPFGLSFLILKTIDVALEHLPFGRKSSSSSIHVADLNTNEVENVAAVGENEIANAAADVSNQAHAHVDVIYSHQAMFLLGLVIFVLIHFPVIRRFVVLFFTTAWTMSKSLIIDVPLAILRWRIVDAILKSVPTMLFRRFLIAPLIATGVFWQLLPRMGVYPMPNRWWGTAIFLFSYLLLNSRVGRDTEELAREFFARTWYRIRVHLVMGLFTLIVDIFNAIMDGLERILYAVDEWLRFRSGESNLTLGLKAIVGLVWSFVHGVIRFCVTLLIEPQVNPIKHFPVVTVSHKLVITTLTVPIWSILKRFFANPATAYTVTALILTCIPGVFGFLAWELKENWKLYKANRSPKLRPVPIGDHGETLLRLLRIGFHSGTIPRLFANCRRASRSGPESTTVNMRAKFAARMHHESIAVQHFVEREFLSLLRETRTFRDRSLSVGGVELTTNRVLVTIRNESMPEEPLKLEFAEQSGWLVGAVRETGWLKRSGAHEIEVLQFAVRGLNKLASVDVIREQIESLLNANSSDVSNTVFAYDIDAAGIVIWPKGNFESEIHYSLDEEPASHPRPRHLARLYNLNPIPVEKLDFKRQDLLWEDWSSYWDQERIQSV